MNRWTAGDIPDQAGRVAVVTGGNTGLGYETAKALAHHGATVVLACRDTAKAERAAQRIGDDTRCVRLDLASLTSVHDAAAQLRSQVTRIDLLVNNAGVMMKGEARTEDGFELQFGTNHLGHFALTGLLLDLMTGVPGSRVVTVSSPVYVRGRYPQGKHFIPIGAYSDSKLANLLFALELQRRLAEAGAGTTSLAAHPGYAETELLRHQPQVMQLGSMLGVPLIGQNAAMGALPILRAATDPAAQGGGFYRPRWQTRGYPVLATPLPRARDTEAARRLWAESEARTHIAYKVSNAGVSRDPDR
jgi:NAD(P)-dependent dehydrogenase (short-subunit alcohol dehydrogenase family)